MRFEGTVVSHGKFWAVEIPALNLSTQGMTLKEGYAMARAVVEDIVGKQGFKVNLEILSKGHFAVGSDDVAELVALMLKRQRAKHGLSLMEVAERMGSRSPNAFGAYEQGKREPTLTTLEKLIRVIDPSISVTLSLRP